MEFPLEWHGNSPAQRTQAMHMMLEAPVNEDGQPLHEFLVEQGISLSVSVPKDVDFHSFEIMLYLSDRGIPFCAWVGTKDYDGYFLNHRTAEFYMSRALQIAEWADQSGIALGGIGLDIEPSLQTMEHMSTGQLGAFAKSIIDYRRWTLQQSQRQGALSRINDGVAQLREDPGIYVETYTAPPLLHKFLGLPTPNTADGRVEMLYSSLYGMRSVLFRILWRIHDDPAFGIVNGVPGQTPGRDFGEKLRHMGKNEREKELKKMHLTDGQLAEDLRIANAISIRKTGHPLSRVYVFAMNAPNVAVRVNAILNIR